MKTTSDKVLAVVAICLSLIPISGIVYGIIQIALGNVTSTSSFEF